MRNKNESLYLNCSRNQASSDVLLRIKRLLIFIIFKKYNAPVVNKHSDTLIREITTIFPPERLYCCWDLVNLVVVSIYIPSLYPALPPTDCRLQTEANKINLIFHTHLNMQDQMWCSTLIMGATIISQTLQKGCVGFQNNVKLFCMLLFAPSLVVQAGCQGSSGESIGHMKIVFKCLYSALRTIIRRAGNCGVQVWLLSNIIVARVCQFVCW